MAPDARHSDTPRPAAITRPRRHQSYVSGTRARPDNQPIAGLCPNDCGSLLLIHHDLTAKPICKVAVYDRGSPLAIGRIILHELMHFLRQHASRMTNQTGYAPRSADLPCK